MKSEQQRKRILVIDDNPEIHSDYRKILCSDQSPREFDAIDAFLNDESGQAKEAASNPQFELGVDSAFQGQEALEKVIAARDEGRPYSMAFVDMRMPPGWDGLTTIEAIWKECPDLQVVICTAYSDNSWKDILERFGRTDKLLILKKPFDRVEVAQLAVALTEKWDLTRKAQMKQRDLENLVEERTRELKHAAMHDSLTELANRKLFQFHLVEAIQRARRHGVGISLILLDLDRFKLVNDTLGHPCGDALLKEAAARLLGCVRNTDTVARLGGDEFAIIRTDVDDPIRSGAAIERIINVMNEPYKIDGQSVECGVSMGVVTFCDDGFNPEELIRKADLALYRAKQNGRNQYRHFDRHMDAEVTAVRNVQAELRSAVAREEFCIHYQPIFGRDGQITSFEALVRWDHPTRGVLAPSEFIQVAEDIGLIVPIGALVLQNACRQAATWPDNIRVAVNVSASQLDLKASFGELVIDTLKETGISADRLELEITEGVLIRECDEIRDTLHFLRDLGVRIVLDDFGVGFSSLSYLHSFPFDKLKLDRNFVMASTESEDAQVIVRAVAGLGENLGLETTAEGVETKEQYEFVKAAGFVEFQGFLLGKPASAKKTALLVDQSGKPSFPVVGSQLDSTNQMGAVSN